MTRTSSTTATYVRLAPVLPLRTCLVHATKPTLTDSPRNDTCSRSRRRSPRKHASSRVFDSFSDEEEGAVPRKAIATPSPSKAVAVAAKRAGVRAPRRLLALAEVSRAARCYHGGHNPARASFAHVTND